MKIKITLLLIILTGFILRLVGIRYGMPFPLVSDEEVLIGGSLRMLELKTLLPVLQGHALDMLYYPTLLPYLYLLVMTPVIGYIYISNGLPAPDQLGLLVLNNLELIWILTRLTSVIMGTATLYIVYQVSSLVTNSKIAGIVACALLCVDFMHVMLSHVTRHWSATVFLTWLAALLSIRYYQHPTLKRSICLGICCGFGFGASYIGGIAIGFAMAAHFMSWKLKKSAFWNSTAILGGLFYLLTIVLFILIHPYPLLRLMQGTVVPLYEEKTILGLISVVTFYCKALWNSNPTLIISAIFGAICLILSSKRALTIGALITICVYITFLYKALPLEDRYILPITPVLAIFGGYGFAYLWKKTLDSKPAQFVVSIFYVMIFSVPLSYSVYSSLILERNDTRIEAKNWLEKNAPDSSFVLVNMNTVRLYQNQKSLEMQRDIEPQSLKAIDRIRLNQKSSLEKKVGIDSVNLWQLSSAAASEFDLVSAAKIFESYRFKYYVFDDYGSLRTPTLHKELSSKMEVIRKFEPCANSTKPPMLRTTILIPYPIFRIFDCDRFGTNVTIVKLMAE